MKEFKMNSEEKLELAGVIYEIRNNEGSVYLENWIEKYVQKKLKEEREKLLVCPYCKGVGGFEQGGEEEYSQLVPCDLCEISGIVDKEIAQKFEEERNKIHSSLPF